MGTFAPSTQSVLGWVYLVTIGSVVGYTAYVWLLANAPLSLVSTYAFMNPIVAISLGVLFQGEQLGWRLVIGAAIVVAAVAIVVTAGAARGDPARRRGAVGRPSVGAGLRRSLARRRRWSAGAGDRGTPASSSRASAAPRRCPGS